MKIRRIQKSFLSLVALAAFAGLSATASATNQTWTGGTSTDWANLANWNSTAGPVPANGDVALFNTAFTNQPTLTASTNNVGLWLATGVTTSGTISTGANTLNLAGNTTINGNANTAILLDDTANHNLTIGSGGTTAVLASTSFLVNNTGTLTLQGGVNIASGSTLTLGGTNATGTTTISGQIANTNGAIKITTVGTVNLTNSNLYSGGTEIAGGTVNVGSATALGSGTINFTTALSTLQAAAGVDLSGANKLTNNITINTSQIKLLAGSATAKLEIGGTVNLGGAQRQIGVGDPSNSALRLVTISGVISNDGGNGLRITRGPNNNQPSWIILSGLNTYTGATTIDTFGAVSVSNIGNSGAASNLGKSGTINLGLVNNNRGGTLGYTGAGETTNKVLNLGSGTTTETIDTTGATGGLVFSAAPTFAAGTTSDTTLNLQGNSTGNELQGNLTDNAPKKLIITKNGTGTWTLSGSNSYTGTTTVTLGTLLINGDSHSATGAVTVSANATLGGTGTIGGATTAQASSFLAPGTDGTAGNLTLASTLDISGLDSTGTGHLKFDLGSVGSSDKITLSSGVLTIGTGTLNFDDFSFTNLTGFGNGTYTLFHTTQTISGSLGSSLTGTINGLNATLSFANANQDIVLSVVPEPSTYAMVAGGFAMLIGLQGWRRRRN